MTTDLNTICPFAGFLGSFLTQDSDLISGVAVILLISAAVVLFWFVLLLPQLYLIEYIDRKFEADAQMRIGPNRVSVYGLAQGVADFLKSISKEDVLPAGLSARGYWLFHWGPLLAIASVFVGITTIPFSNSWVLSNTNAGIPIVIGALTLSHLWIVWAAYFARQSGSVLSAFGIISAIAVYTVPVILTLVPPILIAGSANIRDLVASQGGMPWHWTLFHDPGAFLSCGVLFFSLLIWQARHPWDLAKAPIEVYSGIRKHFIGFLGTLSFFLSCSLIVAVYLGGGNAPFGLESFGRAGNLVQWIIFTAKVFVVVFLCIWIRISLPRFRLNQIVETGWKVLVPTALVAAIATSFWLVFL